MPLSLVFCVGKNRLGFVVVGPFALSIFRREDWLLANKEQVERSVGFFGLTRSWPGRAVP